MEASANPIAAPTSPGKLQQLLWHTTANSPSGANKDGDGGSGSSSRRNSASAQDGNVKDGLMEGTPINGDADGSTEGEPPLAPVSFRTLFRHASFLDRALLVVGTLAAVAQGVLMPLFAVLFGNLIDTGNNADAASPQAVLDATGAVAWKILLLGGLAGVLSIVHVYCFQTSAQRQGVRIRTLFVESLLRQEMAWYDRLNSGTLTSHVAGDVDLIQAGMGVKIASCLQLASTAVAGFAIAFIHGWKLTLVLLSMAPALLVVGGLFGKLAAEATTGGQDAYAKAGAVAEEALALIRTVVAFGGEASEAAKYDRLLRRAAKDEERRAHLTGVSVVVCMAILMGVYALAFWFGNKEVRSGNFSSGDVVTVFFSIILAAMGLGQAAPGISAMHAARGAAPRVFDVIGQESAIDATDGVAGVVPPSVGGRMELRGVDFSYPTRPDRRVLHDMSVVVNKGQTLALVGPSGGGKVRGARGACWEVVRWWVWVPFPTAGCTDCCVTRLAVPMNAFRGLDDWLACY